MNDEFTLEPVARIHSDFSEKFGIPRQSGLVESLTAEIVFEPAYRVPEAVRGLDGFSHCWLIWGFTANKKEDWTPTVRPPRLGGNTRMGVFATRSPYRPNRLGLSCVKLDGIRMDEKLGPVLTVRGADLLDGTPIFDIKPYVPHADCRPEAVGGFADPAASYALAVDIPAALLEKVPEEKREALRGILAQDPRPAYQSDAVRVYGISFANLAVKFSVADGTLTVLSVEKEKV